MSRRTWKWVGRMWWEWWKLGLTKWEVVLAIKTENQVTGAWFRQTIMISRGQSAYSGLCGMGGLAVELFVKVVSRLFGCHCWFYSPWTQPYQFTLSSPIHPYPTPTMPPNGIGKISWPPNKS